MCGIALIRGPVLNSSSNLIKDISKILADRGKDAWGYALFDFNDELFIYDKIIGNIGARKNQKNLNKLVRNKKNLKSILLHSRLATSGFSGVMSHNQPIQKNGITLVHNGLIDFDKTSDNTDSIFLANLVASCKNFSEISSQLNSLSGEISTVWFNSNTKNFYFYTNVGGLYAMKYHEIEILVSEPLVKNLGTTSLDFFKVSSREVVVF